MSRIGIFYGSNTGNTKSVANRIAKLLVNHVVELHDVASASTNFSSYDLLLFGSSTWGYGELQDDWEEYIEELENADLKGKKVALFGVGDSLSYPTTFGNALRIIYDVVKDRGAILVGEIPIQGYTFQESESEIDEKFVGLLLDEDNEAEKTDSRIASWLEKIEKVI